MTTPAISLHRVSASDIDDLLAYELRNEEFHRPTSPIREGGEPAPEERRQRIVNSLSAPGRAGYVIRIGSQLVGTIALSNITRGAWCNATMGYSVDEQWTRRGIASASTASRPSPPIAS